MSDIDYLTLFTRFCGFKLVVMANRLGCDNHLARCAHDRLVAKLCQLIELMREALAAERETALDEASTRYQTACEDLFWIEAEFANRWLSDRPHPLLDDLIIDLGTREIFDARSRCWRPLGDTDPSLREVTDGELCSLRSIIDQIANETGVSFAANRLVYGDFDGVSP